MPAPILHIPKAAEPDFTGPDVEHVEIAADPELAKPLLDDLGPAQIILLLEGWGRPRTHGSPIEACASPSMSTTSYSGAMSP
jgi:hypothetical protein